MNRRDDMKPVDARRRALLTVRAALALAMVASGFQPAVAQQDGGRRQNEFRIPLGRGARPVLVRMITPGSSPNAASVPGPAAGASAWGRSYPSRSTGFDGATRSSRGPASSSGAATGAIDILVPSSAAGRSAHQSIPEPPARSARDTYAPAGPGRTLRVRMVGSDSAPAAPPTGSASSATGSFRETVSPRAAAAADYRLGPGDVIEVFVWRNPELSREVPVRPDGRISLPLMGELQAAGRTAGELQNEITLRLADYVQMPTVSITVSEIRSNVVYVLGNVNSPGPVDMIGNLSALQAIAMSGGLNEFADRSEIAILRTDSQGRPQRWTFRYDDVVKGKDLSTNVLLQAGDVIYVP